MVTVQDKNDKENILKVTSKKSVNPFPQEDIES